MSNSNFFVLAGENLSGLDVLFKGCCLEQYDNKDKVVRYIVDGSFKLPELIKQELLMRKVDWAILPLQKFSDLGLIVSDMDSTLITIECIDEIADMAGIKEEVFQITQQAMQGKIDFETSLKKRVKLLKGLTEQDLKNVLESRLKLTQGAKFLIEECQKNDIKFVLISGGFTFFTDYLYKSLRLTAAFSNILEIQNGILTGEIVGEILDANAKAKYLKQYREAYGLEKNQVVAMGDGANDIEMMKEAGISFAYHAKPKTKEYATFCIDFYGLDFVRYCFI
ncbi:MAG: phosphoserine phosphatase SerB [Neisseriaceae bacterium]|nr:MAG: phosphoserine phosphatase SerB [Neisseriaceae bacterium]